ncbi:MAG TPA: pirin family protein, partial [Flavisolibacter sp.]|nr:pirin family protein [Flavisolibacter sp.]
AVPMNAVDPFLFLNHHGRQEYQPNNHGLPFGPHPHRGFETVTFILEGDLTHRDSSGANSVIKAGGVQWMTAGSGLIHAEISSDEFKAKGGPLEILQLWVNLPARLKMTAPKYIGLQQENIPVVPLDEGRVKLYPVAGTWNGVQGPVQALTDIHLCRITFQENGTASFTVPAEQTIFFYVVKGVVTVNGQVVQAMQLVQFEHDGEEVEIKAGTAAQILFGYATPFREPFVAHGPFVMNTKAEIVKAYDDYSKGKLGTEDLL